MTDKRVRDRIKRIEKLETELLSDEEIAVEKSDAAFIAETFERELMRRTVVAAALSVILAIFMVGFLNNPTPLNLIFLIISAVVLTAALWQYRQKRRTLSELLKAMDKLYVIS